MTYFDPSVFDDDTLDKKIFELQNKILHASYLSNGSQAVTQLHHYLDQLIFERDERLKVEMFKMMEKQFPSIIETDPIKENTDVEKGKDGNVGRTNKEVRKGLQQVFQKRYSKRAPSKPND